MNKTFVAGLCLLLAGSMAAQKKAVDQASKMAGKPDKIEEARTLLKGAMENPETANDARTYYVAGQVEWKTYDNIKAMNAIKGITTLDDDMAMMLMNGFNYYLKAMELDPTPDAKGKANRFTKDIINQIGGHDWDFYSAGVNFYNDKNYPSAYGMLNAAADIPANPALKGVSATLIPDSTRGQVYYLAGISAYSSKLSDGSNLVPEALKAFKNAADLNYDEPNIYLFQIACLDNMANGDSTLIKQYYPQKIELAKAGFAKYGAEQPNYLGYIIDDYINEQNNAQAALDFLNKAIADNPDVAKFVSMRGYVKGRMKDDKGYLEDTMAAAAMPNADTEVLYDAARASFRYGQAMIGTLGIGQGDAAKRVEYIKQYIDPALELATKAKSMDKNGIYTSKLQKLIDDIDYLINPTQNN